MARDKDPEKEGRDDEGKMQADSDSGRKEELGREEELQDRLLRLAAEFDNYKKRSVKEIEGAKVAGKAELAARLLPVLDELEMALKNMDMKTEQEKGIAIVASNLQDMLKKEGLQEIECSGVYDPYRHEVMMAKDSGEKEGTIIDVVRKGYSFRGIMLRPASVIVSRDKENGLEDRPEKDGSSNQ